MELDAGADDARRTTRAIACLLALAAALYAWNAVHVTPLTGYDAAGHAAYVLTLVTEHRLPEPLEGWSTFHPPAYYLIAAVVWRALEPLGPAALNVGLRAVSGVSLLFAACVLAGVLRARGFGAGPSVVAVALALFLPCTQLAATTIGNEATGVAFASLALAFVLALQRDPTRAGAAACAGVFVGLALATKYSGVFVAAACLVPFLRRPLDRRARKAAALVAAGVVVVAGPVYVRNAVSTGSPVPMTREEGPAARLEGLSVARPRRLADYLVPSPSVLLRPFHGGGAAARGARDDAMRNVWGATYASFWYDAHGHRVPARLRGSGAGPLLAALGLVPTALVLAGFALALRDAARSRGRSADAPLVAMALVGLAAYVAFTLRAPGAVATKGSYLLPLLVPAGVFFARGVSALRGAPRRAALAASAAAALAAALVFTTGLVFPPMDPGPVRAVTSLLADQLPGTHLDDALARLLPPAPSGR